MKKILIFISVFYALNSNAQDYYITFTGTGASSAVSTVKVENLTSGASLVMSGNDVLHLTSITTGIKPVKNDPFSRIRIYPNPMTDYATVQIFPPVAGEAVLRVLDITGNPVATVQYYLDNSRQDFRLSGLNTGLYLINVAGSNYQFSGKLVSTGDVNGQITVEKVNSIAQMVDKKATEEKVSKGVQGTVDMPYTPGDRLKFTGKAENYSTIWIDIPTSDKTITFDFMPCVDGDNNSYPVVEIGTQVWMAENLRTSKYRNGDLIQSTTPATISLLSEVRPIYQWAYGGDENNSQAFGRLYTWYATNGNNLCPSGWHLPTDAEWTTLTDFLGGLNISGGKLKEVGYTHWNSPNNGATDEMGFAALPGGYRFSTGGFGGLGSDGIWWSLTDDNTHDAGTLGMGKGYGNIYVDNNSKRSGYSVRCLQGEVKLLPVLTTTAVTSITRTNATAGGQVISDAGATVTARGLCWDTSPNPIIEDSKTIDGTGTGTFSSSINGLAANTTYYLRAYATNSVGTAYGNELIFKTYSGTITDVEGNVYYTVTIGTQVWMAENLKTAKYSNGDLIGTTSTATLDISYETNPKYQWAYAGIESNVATYGRLYTWYTLIDNRNVCPIGWHIPTRGDWQILTFYLGYSGYKSMAASWGWTKYGIAGSIGYDLASNNSSGFTGIPGGYRTSKGSFRVIGGGASWWSTTVDVATMVNYASLGTSFNYLFIDYIEPWSGLSVRCLQGEAPIYPVIPVLTTSAVSSITSNSAISGGNVTSDGGAPIRSRGVCWSTTPNPTIANTTTIDGTGAGVFTSTIIGLTANTTYYLRAYANNMSGISYGNELIFITYKETVKDIDGNVYNAVTIGTQVWMAENLKTSKYNDGTAIPLVTNNADWTALSTPGYCWYNNDAATYKATYGALYNWYTVDAVSNGEKNVCPAGWHIPAFSEWKTLINYLGGQDVAGNKLKEGGTVHWFAGNTATNESGFTALPGGYRVEGFQWLGEFGYWWSSTFVPSSFANELFLGYYYPNAYLSSILLDLGLSVRCLRYLK